MWLWQEAVKKSLQWATTGAGTSVELNKKGEADETADNNGWAGRAAEGNGGRARPMQSKQTVFG
jgi:ribosomal protein L44E